MGTDIDRVVFLPTKGTKGARSFLNWFCLVNGGSAASLGELEVGEVFVLPMGICS